MVEGVDSQKVRYSFLILLDLTSFIMLRSGDVNPMNDFSLPLGVIQYSVDKSLWE